MSAKLLVVDDDATHRRMLETVLEAEGYRVTLAADGPKALEVLQREGFEAVLLDIRMPGQDGLEVLAEIRRVDPKVSVIMMTAYASLRTAVEALRQGADDYLTKPLNIDELKILLKKTLRLVRLESENRELRARLEERQGFDRIIGGAPAMRALFETLALVAPSEASVLIRGESGTGKELVADALHKNSPRRDGPLVKVNCAALPETLLESELFGHEKGAFTGAERRREGRFQNARGGTILLDEIAEISVTTQAKLLRVLQERECEPLGSSRSVPVDVRIIAATNRDLETAIQEGRFRQDLYYRLNVVSLVVPPLRERREDILPLAQAFLQRFSRRNQKLVKGLSPEASAQLTGYDWPGNVRELENAMERAVILCRDDYISLVDLPDVLQGTRTAPLAAVTERLEPGLTLKDLEREMILATLKQTGGNRTRAAEMLGISRRTLQLKLKEYSVN